MDDIELYNNGKCNTTNYLDSAPGSGCCRVSCRNCSAWLENEVFEGEIDYFELTYTFLFEALGAMDLSFAVYAPDGWQVEDVAEFPLIKLPIPSVFDMKVGYHFVLGANVKTSNKDFVFGARFNLNNIKLSGILASDNFPSNAVKEFDFDVYPHEIQDDGSWIFLEISKAIRPIYVISLGKSKTVAGINAEGLASIQFQTDLYTSISYNVSRFDARNTQYFIENSHQHVGRCDQEHIIEYELAEGRRATKVIFRFVIGFDTDIILQTDSFGVKIDADLTLIDTEATLDFPLYDYRTSLLSGCITSAYDIEVNILLDPSRTIDYYVDQLTSALAGNFNEGSVTIKKLQSSATEKTGVISISITNSQALKHDKDSLITLIQQPLESNAISGIVRLCEDGYHGSDCTSQCSKESCSGMIVCHSITGIIESCTACNLGYYGDKCESKCTSDNCLARTITCSKENGMIESCTACNLGYYGDKCESECTSENCLAGTMTCSKENGMIESCTACNLGYYGDKCESKCTSDNCLARTMTCSKENGMIESCTACNLGYYGDKCESKCTSENCLAGTIICSKQNGMIESCSACKTGFYGDKCESECASENCLAGTITCSKENGMIESCSACKTGFYGEKCEFECDHENCLAGTITCDATSGIAISCDACTDAQFGLLCESQCTAPNCPTEKIICDSSDGKFISCAACSPSYFGINCDQQCTHKNCISGGILCDSKTGITSKCETCVDGYEGVLCDKKVDFNIDAENENTDDENNGTSKKNDNTDDTNKENDDTDDGSDSNERGFFLGSEASTKYFSSIFPGMILAIVFLVTY